jgi:hypothetical protein
MDCVRWAQDAEGMPQSHYNFSCAFLRKGHAILERLGESYGPKWTLDVAEQYRKTNGEK